MRTLLLSAIAVGFLGFAGTAYAGGAVDPSCFGQARSTGASDTFNPSNPSAGVSPIGEFFSARKGTNAQRVIDYKNLNCNLGIPADPQNAENSEPDPTP